jgi:hypothetical protein
MNKRCEVGSVAKLPDIDEVHLVIALTRKMACG